MNDRECVEFLRWALPRLDLRYKGYRKVRRQVCRRISRRIAALGLATVASYREYLDRNPEEWRVLDGLCRITISRFYRDRGTFDYIGSDILPTLTANARERGCGVIRCWSAGCGSGEEPYTLSILWRQMMRPDAGTPSLEIVATDVDPHLLSRAEKGCYGRGTLKEIPDSWYELAIEQRNGSWCVNSIHRANVEFREEDIRATMPTGPFDLILCRNLAFTYFTEELQAKVLDDLARRLRANGYLVIGRHESLPENAAFDTVEGRRDIFLKT